MTGIEAIAEILLKKALKKGAKIARDKLERKRIRGQISEGKIREVKSKDLYYVIYRILRDSLEGSGNKMKHLEFLQRKLMLE